MEVDKPLYESVASTIEQFLARYRDNAWEYTRPRGGIVYGRRHISGKKTESDAFSVDTDS